MKTTYDMRISDWSSDGCSSDLPGRVGEGQAVDAPHVAAGRLDIAYLTPEGEGFAVAKRFPKAVEEGSFGQMTGWSVSDAFADTPVIAADGGFTGQGYT